MTVAGFIGLGKLGLPCALAMESFGHEIIGYDSSPAVQEIIRTRQLPYREEGAQELLERTQLCLATNTFDVVAAADLVFVPVQTPHDPRFEGVTPLTDDRADFDYSYLKAAVNEIALAALWQRKSTTVVIVSTVLPGTIEREIKPLLNEYTHLVYNPSFIAMGTTIADFTNPEFVLVGCDDRELSTSLYAETVRQFYRTIHDRPIFMTNVETAELVKVAYNTFVGMKIVFANTIMETCEKTNADCDDVIAALSLATDRVISPKYLRGGMGDGGGCHPRDAIAMSWLAQKLDLSHDLFADVMSARDDQTRWIAYEAARALTPTCRRVVVLGKAYKPETNLAVGSPAVLLTNIADLGFYAWDPHVDPREDCPVGDDPKVFVIGTKHAEFATYTFPKGSVVIDPWGYIPDQVGVDVRRLGRKRPLGPVAA